MPDLDPDTLETIAAALGARAFSRADLEAVSARGRGAISGLGELIEDLRRLDAIELGDTPPAGPLQPKRRA